MSVPAALLASVREACIAAGAAILALRAGTPGLAAKADGSPVTAADLAASRILLERLGALEPEIPVVCEEGAQHTGGAARFWLVDPLDGTREFVRGSDRFTVNVALIEAGRAVLGLIHAPASGVCWWGGAGLGAWRDGVPIRSRRLPAAPRVLMSPAEPLQPPAPLLAALQRDLPGAGLECLPGVFKFCLLAEGQADCHPRTVPSCAWDSAAGQALLEGAGGAVWDLGGAQLAYPPRPQWRNPAFVAVGDAARDWSALWSV